MLLTEKLNNFHALSGCMTCVHLNKETTFKFEGKKVATINTCWKGIDRKCEEFRSGGELFLDSDGFCKLREGR